MDNQFFKTDMLPKKHDNLISLKIWLSGEPIKTHAKFSCLRKVRQKEIQNQF